MITMNKQFEFRVTGRWLEQMISHSLCICRW